MDDRYAARVAAEKSIYRDCLDIHNLPDIFHYWSDRYVRPKLEAFGFSNPNEMFQKYVSEQCRRQKNGVTRIASIGSGNCDLEIELASHLRAAGHADFVIDCLDLNPAMLERGRAAAASDGVDAHLNFVPVDLNAWTPAHEYDAIVANQSLHHILNLEHLFSEIKRSLKPRGSFIMSDMIGRNGHQRWPEALDIVREFWRKLPPSYRFNQKTQRYDEVYQNHDCSVESFEGIRCQDILPLLADGFDFQLFVAFANAIDPFVDPGFGENFDAAAAWDRNFIDQVHQRDEEEIGSGRLKPTHMLAVVGNSPAIPMLFHAPLTPKFCIRTPSIGAPVPEPDVSFEDAYDWHSWPHNPQRELEIACRRQKGISALVEERTAWAVRLDRELQEVYGELEQRTNWALRLGRELEELNRMFEDRTAWALQLDKERKERATERLRLSQDLERLAWARALDRYFHKPLSIGFRMLRGARAGLRQLLSGGG